jgi:hypothetical protein
MQATEEPEHEKYGQYHAHGSTESSSTIPLAPIVPSTAAKQQGD